MQVNKKEKDVSFMVARDKTRAISYASRSKLLFYGTYGANAGTQRRTNQEAGEGRTVSNMESAT